MPPSVKIIFVKSMAAALLSVAASLGIAAAVLPLLGGSVDGTVWIMCTLCPLAIAGPASAVQFWQTERLRMARDALADMHARLDEAHRDLALAHEALAERARRDAMTGAYNRETFFQSVEEALAAPEGGALLVIDADRFKAINDRFGHLAGDRALRAIAHAAAETVGAADIFGRIGGEEFAAFLPGAGEEEARAVAESIRGAVRRAEVRAEEGYVPLAVSIGVAVHRPGMTVTGLVGEADRLLYEAKRRGRDRVVSGLDEAA